MNFLIHIEINEVNLLHYQKKIIDWSKENIPDINTVDFDNHSDSFLIDAALKLIKEADKIALIIEAGLPEGNTGGVIKFLNALLRLKKDQVMVIFNGQHEMIKRMVMAFGQHHFDLDFDAQKERLALFFKS